MSQIKGDIRRCLRIHRCPEELERALELVLTFANPDYKQVEKYSPYGTQYTKIPQQISLMVRYPKWVEIPRGYDYGKLLTGEALDQFNSIQWEDLRVQAPVEHLKCTATLNDEQRAIAERFRKAQANNERPYGTYSFVSPTSSGKTLAAAYMASTTGQRTLVLCKTNLIRRAWEEDLTKHFGIPRTKIGRIQMKHEVIGEHFTLASLATLHRRQDRLDWLLSHFGCVVIDELQIIGADTIYKTVGNCQSKYVIGVTATDHRKDGKDFLVRACLGRPLIRLENKQEETQSSFPLGAVSLFKTDYEWLDPDGYPIDEPDFFAVCDDMRKDKVRNSLIVQKVVEDWKSGRHVLVVSHRIAHCELLLRKLREAGVEDANLLTGSTNQNKQYTEGLIQGILAGTIRCVVASKEVVKLGANLNPLDVLHCALPIGSASDLEQLVGRIRRKYPGKKGCRLVWYHDVNVPYLQRKYKSVLIPVLRKLKVPGYERIYVA